MRSGGWPVLSWQQMQRQRLLLQRTMRGRVGGLREHSGRHWRNHRDQPRRMHSGQVFRMRRRWTALLWNHLRRWPFLPRERLFILWQSRGNLLSRHQRDRPMCDRLGVQHGFVHMRPVRIAGCALLPGQYLQQRLLLQRQLSGRRLSLHQQ